MKPKLIQFNLYLSPRMLEDIENEAKRLDVSMGWVLKKAWDLGRVGVADIEPETIVRRRRKNDPQK